MQAMNDLDHLLRVVVAAEPRGGHRVFLRFDDGVEGVLDLRPILKDFRGVWAPLRSPSYVRRVRVDFGTIAWPNDADIDPVVLYFALKGVPLPDFEALIRLEDRKRGVPAKRKARAARRAGRGRSSRRRPGT
jgi:hypothetical protein